MSILFDFCGKELADYHAFLNIDDEEDAVKYLNEHACGPEDCEKCPHFKTANGDTDFKHAEKEWGSPPYCRYHVLFDSCHFDRCAENV